MSLKPREVSQPKKMPEGIQHYMDGDMLSFVIASACEKKTVKVTHKPSGTTKEFKNKTEFQGRGKKIGGWLGELNKNREADEKPIFELDQFELTEHYEADPVENCLHSIKQKMIGIQNHLGVDHTHLVMGKGNNFRHDLLMPTRYKANREGAHKPLLLDEARNYLLELKKAELVTEIEADDRLGHYQYQGHKAFLETGTHSTIVTAVDKDARQTDGLLNNPTTNPTNGEFLYPEPLVVNGLGELYLNNKKAVKGHGRAWLYFQIGSGDDTDGYNPTKPFFKGVGEKKIFDALCDCKSDKDYWEKLVELYHDWFPTGLQYEAWDGTEMDIKPVDWMQMMATCAFMQRWEGDSLDVKKVLKSMSITHD